MKTNNYRKVTHEENGAEARNGDGGRSAFTPLCEEGENSPRSLPNPTVIYSVFLIAGICIANLWENEALQRGEISLKYVQPGVIIYMNHTFMLLNLIVALYLYSKRTETPLLSSVCMCRELIHSSLIEPSGWTVTEALKKMTWLAFLYYVPNLFWAASLNYIPVSISVAMQQSQCGFVYLLGVWWQVIPANRVKFISCAFCILGVVLVSIGTVVSADDRHNSSTSKTGIEGDGSNNVILGLIFAVVFPTTISFFSIYFKLYSKHCTNLERTCTLTGVIGITNTFFMIPFIMLQPMLGLGPVFLPDTGDTFILIIYIGILAFLYNFFYMTGISVMGPLTSKLYKRHYLTNITSNITFSANLSIFDTSVFKKKASLGVALCLPTSIIYDMVFKGSNVLNGLSFLGCFFIFGAFVSIIRAGDSEGSDSATSGINNNSIENTSDETISNGAFGNGDGNNIVAV